MSLFDVPCQSEKRTGNPHPPADGGGPAFLNRAGQRPFATTGLDTVAALTVNCATLLKISEVTVDIVFLVWRQDGLERPTLFIDGKFGRRPPSEV